MSKNWFSNFEPFDLPLVGDGISYNTVEHYYQAHKSLVHSVKQHIASQPSASMAKRAGRMVVLRPDWEEKKNLIMGIALNYKFKPTSSWGLRLRITTGEIVEYNNWHDVYWGICTCSKCCNTGKNMLGIMLMNIRARNLEKENKAM